MSRYDEPISVGSHRHGQALVVPVPEPLTDAAVGAMEAHVLPELRSHELKALDLDFGAVDSIDTHALKRCEQLLRGARLLGARVALAAFRPHVAATCIELGFAFEREIVTHSVNAATQQILESRG